MSQIARNWLPNLANLPAMSEAQQMPEGWYEDPSNPGTQRYWDGEAWIPGLSITPEPKKNPAAVAGLVFAILSLAGSTVGPVGILPGLVGLVFSSIGVAKRKTGGRSNIAWAGLACNIIGLVMSVWVTAAILPVVLNESAASVATY